VEGFTWRRELESRRWSVEAFSLTKSRIRFSSTGYTSSNGGRDGFFGGLGGMPGTSRDPNEAECSISSVPEEACTCLGCRFLCGPGGGPLPVVVVVPPQSESVSRTDSGGDES